ncbi:MAG: hypothetical protein WAQ51_01340, partial [Candidatus Microthrix parvicella]
IPPGCTGCMALTLRLTDDESDALRARADLEQRSMQDVAREAVRIPNAGGAGVGAGAFGVHQSCFG